MSGANPYVAHQFDTALQQKEAASMGMWAFLVTEIMFFGGIFVSYAVYRNAYPEMFVAMSGHLDWLLGAVNTAVLLTSSLTMALAVNGAKTGNQKRLFNNLVLTLIFSLVFLVVKYFEYAHKFHVGTVPGKLWHFDNPFGDEAQIFYSLYFAATGLHGFHVLIGAILIAIYAVMAKKGKFHPQRYMPVECLGLYWHFVDLIWIYVYPLFYLIGHLQLGGGH